MHHTAFCRGVDNCIPTPPAIWYTVVLVLVMLVDLSPCNIILRKTTIITQSDCLYHVDYRGKIAVFIPSIYPT